MEFYPKKCQVLTNITSKRNIISHKYRAGTTTYPEHCLGAHQNGQEQWWISLLSQELAVCGLQGNWLSTG
jgi:hypothetical protein